MESLSVRSLVDMCFVLQETKSSQFKKLEVAFFPRERRDCAVVQEILSHLVGLVEKME